MNRLTLWLRDRMVTLDAFPKRWVHLPGRNRWGRQFRVVHVKCDSLSLMIETCWSCTRNNSTLRAMNAHLSTTVLRPRLQLTLTLVIAALAACHAAPEDKTSRRIDEIVNFRVTNKEFSGSVLIAKGDNIVFNRGYGLANIEWGVPNTATTKFRLGSITKQFTAAAILLLEEDGKLHLEDPVRVHWPEAPRAWDKVTIFHLLTHTSGMAPPDETWRFSEGPAEETVGHFRDRPLEFEPGSEFRYSNSGFILLAYLIERISGQSYSDFLEERILTPLGMKDSGVESNGPIVGNRASGYADGENGWVHGAYLSMPSSIGSGAVYSTTEDLLRWTRGLFGGKLLKANSFFFETFNAGVELFETSPARQPASSFAAPRKTSRRRDCQTRALSL